MTAIKPRAVADAPTHVLVFPQLERRVEIHADETVFHCARRHGIRIVGACGGRGACGTCMVHVTHGRVARIAGACGDVTPEESGDRRKKWVRACQIVARSDITIEVAPRSLAAVARAEVDSGKTETLPLDALVASRDVTVAEPTLADTDSDLDRILKALSSGLTSADIEAARRLPGVLRQAGWSVQARLRDGELISVAAPGSRVLGLAVDLGTTNAAGFLIDLRSGALVASLGVENPQTAWGGDVISRINHAASSQAAAEELRVAAVEAINAIAHDLCRTVGAATSDIVDVAVCANTAMHHLLLGLPVRQLGRAPYVAALREAMDCKARDLGLDVAPGAYVHLAPNVGGFVGGDHVTALLATEDRWKTCATSLVMDIGTNTEISLIHRGAILSASCPSGPALEGGHITCGMRAAEGAIERVFIQEDGAIGVTVIGDCPPVGLCGSGVLDAVATLREAGVVDARGRIVAGHPAVREVGGQRAAILAPGVAFSQHDIRAVQLAKAAIRTGVELLLHEVGLDEGDIERFIIAGAFGAYIDVRSGIAIGLFPDLPSERFAQVGNAAGLGIRRMVASRRARARARAIATRCRYVELSTRGEFQSRFMRNIGFNQ